MTADCITGTYGSNNDGVWISCAVVSGGEARGRADCTAAPDIYTNWITSWASDQNGFCLFQLRQTILELKQY